MPIFSHLRNVFWCILIYNGAYHCHVFFIHNFLEVGNIYSLMRCIIFCVFYIQNVTYSHFILNKSRIFVLKFEWKCLRKIYSSDNNWQGEWLNKKYYLYIYKHTYKQCPKGCTIYGTQKPNMFCKIKEEWGPALDLYI